LRVLGVGIEPDPAFGSGVMATEEPAALFRLPSNAAATPSEAYGGMRLLVGLAASVALASGGMHPDEQHLLIQRIDAARHLPESERARLRAHVQRLEREPANISSFKDRIAAMPEADRREVARFAAGIAAADGRIEPAEVRAIERIYGLLGLDKALVFSDLHAGAAVSSAADEPVAVAAAGRPASGHRLPPAPTPAAPHEVTLDTDRLQRIIADTRRVSAVLGAVFEEEPAHEPDPSTEDESEAADDLAGLDPHHRALVEALLSRAEWPTEDFGRLARSMDLLPDGALVTINEWALERFDDVLVEDGDPLMVNQTLIPPRAREAA
jgi:tellurite resistance protein